MPSLLQKFIISETGNNQPIVILLLDSGIHLAKRVAQIALVYLANISYLFETMDPAVKAAR